jgi:ABC-type glycerol-3-phosphate transport system substrate-binding protein
MKHKFIINTAVFLSLLLIITSFASCTSRNSNVAPKAEDVNFFSDQRLLEDFTVTDAVKYNEYFFCLITESKNNEPGMNNQRSVFIKTDLSGKVLSRLELSDVFTYGEYITYEYLTETNGQIYGLKRVSTVVIDSDGNSSGDIRYTLVNFGETAEEILDINAVIETEEKNLSINAFDINSKNNDIFIYIFTDKVYAVNINTGEIVFKNDNSNMNFRGFCKTSDGSMGLVSEHISPEENYNEISVINTDSGYLEKGTEIPVKGTVVAGDEFYEYYGFTRAAIFGYTFGNTKDDINERKIADLAASVLSVTDIKKLIPLSDGRFAIIANDAVTDFSGLYILTKTEHSDNKINLTVGIFFEDPNIIEMTDKFNRENPDYFVTLKIYGDDSGIISADSPGVMSLNNDIIAGDVLDGLFIGYGAIAFNNYAQKGTFRDLYEFLDDDPDLSKKDFFESLLKTLSSGKSLYQIGPKFYIQSLVAKTSLVGKKAGLSLSKLTETAVENNMELLSPYFSQRRFFDTSGPFRQNNFIDETRGTCSFDSKEFISMLNYAKTLPANSDIMPRDVDPSVFKNNEVLLNYEWISTFRDIIEIEQQFSEPVTFIGFPNEKNGSGIVAEVTNPISIMSSSSHPEGVWEYIKYHLTYVNPKLADLGSAGVMSFPIIISEFNKNAKIAMEEPFVIDLATGEKMYYSEIGLTPKYPPNTPEDNKKITDLIDNIDTIFATDLNIMNIIYDETTDFFSGQNTAEKTAKLIQDRVSTYLAEAK